MNITALPWGIVISLAAAWIFASVAEWIADRWEITCGRPRITRRWYGSHARVCFRAEADCPPARYTVLRWDAEDTGLPWLLVRKLNPEALRYWDEDAEAFWAPVTDFAPDSVRRVRPHLASFGRLRIPALTDYRPLILRGES